MGCDREAFLHALEEHDIRVRDFPEHPGHVRVTFGPAAVNEVVLDLLQSIELLANVASALADAAIKGFKVNKAKLDDALERNPILVTALNPVIGYEKGAAIAKKAYKEGRAIREVAAVETQLKPEQLRDLLDPLELTKGGIKG